MLQFFDECIVVNLLLNSWERVTLALFLMKSHCIKSVHIRRYSGPHFPVLGMNTERYSVSLRIHS